MPVRHALTAALLLLLVAAPAASAQITASRITAPAEPYEAFVRAGDPARPTVTIAGTVTGAAGPESVDLTCFGPDDEFVYDVAQGIDVDADGRFAEAVRLTEFDARPCVLRAVPPDDRTLSPRPFAGVATPFAGVEVRVSDTAQDAVGAGGPNAGKVAAQVVRYDLEDAIGGITALGVGCGLERVELLARPTLHRQPTPWSCNGAIWPFEGRDAREPSTRSGLVVDGHDAYLAAHLLADTFRNGLDAVPGLPAMEGSAQREPDGTLRADERHAVVRCPDGTYPPAPATCPAVEDAGVALHRTTRVAERGREVAFADELRSTDGEAHAVDLLVTHEQRGDVLVRLPGAAAFAPLVAGAGVALGGGRAPQTVYVRAAGAGDGVDGVPKAALTLAPAPDALRPLDGQRFVLRYRLTVPAGGAVVLHQVLSQATTQAGVEELAGAAAGRLADPALPPAGPPPGTSAPPAPAPAAPAPAAPPAAGRDRTPPRLTGLALSRTRFRAGSGARRGTTVRWTLSEPADVQLRVERALPGRRRGARCVAPARAVRRFARPCTRYVAVGGAALHRRGAAGAQRLAFPGRLGRRTLAPGRYRLTLTAADAAGNRSSARRIAFTVLRPR